MSRFEKEKLRIGVVFASRTVTPSGVARKEITDEFLKKYSEIVRTIKQNLEETFPEIDFVYGEVSNSIDAINTLKKMEDVIGYLIFAVQHSRSYLKVFIRSGKPTVIIAYTYVGAGALLLAYSKALREGYPVIGEAVRDISNPERINKYVKMLKTIGRLKSAKALLIVGPPAKQSMEARCPLTIDIYGMISDLNEALGINISTMSIEEFNKDYYEKVSTEQAKEIAERWFRNAKRVVDHKLEDLIEPAKLYLAIKDLIKKQNLDAIGIDCILLYYAGLLKTWPCLAFMELTKEGIVCGCEADLNSMAIMLLMKFLKNIPGYINDPSPDLDRNEIVYYHCQAPINPYGYDSKDLSPYTIMPAHWNSKKASVHVELPTDKVVTVIGLNPKRKTLCIHTAKMVKNECNQEECSTKAVGRANVKAILERWEWDAGWHRVLFYGDHREDLKIIGRLLGLTILEEDH